MNFVIICKTNVHIWHHLTLRLFCYLTGLIPVVPHLSFNGSRPWDEHCELDKDKQFTKIGAYVGCTRITSNACEHIKYLLNILILILCQFLLLLFFFKQKFSFIRKKNALQKLHSKSNSLYANSVFISIKK